MSTTEKYYSPKEVAEQLGCSIQAVRAWYRSGKLDAVRAGRNVRISETALQTFLKSWTAGTQSKKN
jgi:excisionase family DNA binding protein